MKILIAAFFLFAINHNTGKSQSIFEKNYIKSIIDKVNNYQVNKDPRTKVPDYNWIRGTYYTGVMACYQTTGDKKFLRQAETLGEGYNWAVPAAVPDEVLSGANLLTITQTWLECYMVKKQQKKIQPLIDHLEKADIKNPVTRPLTWYHESGLKYVDALYVAPPVLAMLYKVTGKEKYASWLDSFFWDVYGTLFNDKMNLFYRDILAMPKVNPVVSDPQWRSSVKHAQITPNGKEIIWSRGNGWAFAGLARVLKYLPKEHGNWKKYEEVFKKMAQSLKGRQNEEGHWRPNLDDPMEYPYKEISGTGFFTYGMAWGINNGILNEAEFKPVVLKAWKSMVNAVNDEGKVQWGQLGGGTPFVVKQEDSYEYVSGIFLLAASEVYKMNFK